MARPVKNNAEYFPHQTGMIDHRKVKILRNEFGSVEGYAFWSFTLEWLTDRDGLEWEDSPLEIGMFAASLGMPSQKIREMVDFSIDIGLLSKTESGFIYSESLQENLQPVFEKRNKERERSKLRQRAEDGTFLQINQTPGVTVTETTTSQDVSTESYPQSKVKESKVKEINIPFSVFWDAYGLKEEKLPCSKKWSALTNKEREIVMADIPIYFKSLSDLKYKKYPFKYLNNKMWEARQESDQSPSISPEIKQEREVRYTNMMQRTQGMEYNREHPMKFHEKISVYHLEFGMYDQLK